MQLEQSFTLPLAPAEAWAAFQRIELLVECLPGAALAGPATDGNWPLRFDVKLGPIAASFAGSGRVTHDDATRTGRFEGSAADKRTQSRVKGAAGFAVQPAPEGSLVQVSVDYQLSGALAQFSRGGIVRELASALTAQFAGNLERRLTAEASSPVASEPPAAVPVVPTSPVNPPPQAVSAPLDTGALLRRVLLARWRRLTHWFLRRKPG
jgi:carbon monoxide dehydrogenase subunit G